MSAPAPVLTMVHSPLGNLEHDEREQVIALLTRQLPEAEAVTLLAALAGTRAEVEAVPMALQEQAQDLLLTTLPPGLGAIVVSKLGIPTKSDQQALDDVLTEPEKADLPFRQRVEAEALRRHIPRWLAASRLRWNAMGPDELVATLQRQPSEPSAEKR